MRGERVLLCLGLAMGLLGGPVREALADSAEVLPKGAKRAAVSSNFFLPIQENYDPDGDREPLASDFNKVIDSGVFPELGLIELGFGMPPGSAVLGTSVVDFEYRITEVTLDFQYGLTDRLTVGISAPYRFFKNKVQAGMDTKNATVGINPEYGTPADKFGVPVIPVAAGGIADDALATEFVLQTLEQGYGYERFETVSQDGFLDVSLGGRYQYFKNERWRSAVTAGVKLPTGAVDDPDDLADFGFGTGAWTPFVHLNQDYVGFKNLVLNGTARYYLILPEKVTLRVPDSVDQEITRNVEKVSRDIGDTIELELSGAYTLRPDLTGYALYRYGYSFEDDVSGSKGYNYSSLEEETQITEHIAIVGLTYSTLNLFAEKKFPVPLEAGISYRTRFAGTNNALASRYVGVTLGVYF